MDFSNIEIIAQGFGFVTLVFGVLAYLSKNDVRLKWLMVISNASLGVHFWLLSVPVASLIAFVAAVRNLASLHSGLQKIWPLFIVFYVGFGVWQYEAWYDVLTVLGVCATTYGYFKLSGIPMRVSFLVGSSLWLVHNIIVGSIGPSLMEAFLVVSLLITMVRIYRDQKELSKPVPPPIP